MELITVSFERLPGWISFFLASGTYNVHEDLLHLSYLESLRNPNRETGTCKTDQQNRRDLSTKKLQFRNQEDYDWSQHFQKGTHLEFVMHIQTSKICFFINIGAQIDTLW